ncbi:MAG: flagellar biosynthetic protein FliO [Pseudomonadota bacterium]|nr:flagellar biosynthetic protein FliO [Pseudomonadota bacterium]
MEFAGVDYMKFLMALIFVLGLIWGLTLAAKHFGFGNRGPVQRGAAKRLSIVDTMVLDPKRRVVIVRVDETEHLLLLGQSGEQVINPNLTASPAGTIAHPQSKLHAIDKRWEGAG